MKTRRRLNIIKEINFINPISRVIQEICQGINLLQLKEFQYLDENSD